MFSSTYARKLGILVLAGGTFCYGQHGRPAGAGSGHMNTGSSAQSGDTRSQTRTPDQLLSKNTKLSANLQKLLPEGMTTQEACSGFKNLGQCVAAIHVSNNLGIPFTDLKTKMTGSDPESLGKAIQQLKPSANAKAEVKKANSQAQSDLNDSAS